MVFSLWSKLRAQGRGRRCNSKGACGETRKRAHLFVESLEDRTNPAPFVSTGALGNLAPAIEVSFNTTDGTYKVDNGPWLSGGVLSTDPGQTTMLYNFSAITLGQNVTVSASGTHALGLLATSNVYIDASLNVSGQSGQTGSNGYGRVGGGGGGGGEAAVPCSSPPAAARLSSAATPH